MGRGVWSSPDPGYLPDIRNDCRGSLSARVKLSPCACLLWGPPTDRPLESLPLLHCTPGPCRGALRLPAQNLRPFDCLQPRSSASLVNRSVLQTGSGRHCSLWPREFLLSLWCWGLPDPSSICAMAVGGWAPRVSSYYQHKCSSLSSDHFLLRENGQRAQGPGQEARNGNPQAGEGPPGWGCAGAEAVVTKRKPAKWLGQNLETLGVSMTCCEKLIQKGNESRLEWVSLPKSEVAISWEGWCWLWGWEAVPFPWLSALLERKAGPEGALKALQDFKCAFPREGSSWE